jgi:phosphohistidine phosphatase
MEPRRLVLVRHAKSSWADPDLVDRDRPLKGRGRRAAALLAQHLRDTGVRPDLALCSSATRARQTLELLSLPATTDVLIEEELYGAQARELLARVRRIPAPVMSVLLVGHNPAIEEFARMLVRANDVVPETFPTGAVADLRIPIDGWPELAAGTGRLDAFVIPRQLGST